MSTTPPVLFNYSHSLPILSPREDEAPRDTEVDLSLGIRTPSWETDASNFHNMNNFNNADYNCYNRNGDIPLDQNTARYSLTPIDIGSRGSPGHVASSGLSYQEISQSNADLSSPLQYHQQLQPVQRSSNSVPDLLSLRSSLNTLEHQKTLDIHSFTPEHVHHQNYVATHEPQTWMPSLEQTLWVPVVSRGFSSEVHNGFLGTTNASINFPDHTGYAPVPDAATTTTATTTFVPLNTFYSQNYGSYHQSSSIAVADMSYDQTEQDVTFNTNLDHSTVSGDTIEMRRVFQQHPLMPLLPFSTSSRKPKQRLPIRTQSSPMLSTTSTTSNSDSSPTRPAFSSRSSTASYAISKRGSPSMVHCNPHIVNEYKWLSLPVITPELKGRILKLAEEKKLKNPNNDQIPGLSTVSGIVDSLTQTNVELKLTILDALYGNKLGDTSSMEYRKLPKMTLREGVPDENGVEILIQTSTGIDEPRPDFINASLVGLRYCPVLRNQLCKTSIADVIKSNADKRPYNSWFLYRGAQMNRASILKLTECLPNDLETLQNMKAALLFNVGVTDKEAYIEHLKQLYEDPHEVRADLTALGYVVAYFWALEPESVKSQLADFSKLEHAHKLKVFPNYKYAPRRPRKRAGSN